ncbi:MAG: hypothetical protein VW405_00640 [Rhodospirillaceae bacterium]
MRPILTIFDLGNFPKGWEQEMSRFAAVSVRDDCLPRYKRAMLLAGSAHENELQGWAWVRARTVQEAQEEGRKHALLCASYGLTRWYVNCEAEWAGVERFPKTPTPYKALRAYAMAWRIYAPSECQLAYNGFSWARTSDGRKLHDAALMQAFDVWAPMVYGNDREGIRRSFPGKVNKYPFLQPCPMLGVGRVEKGDGSVWGYWDVHAELLEAHKVREFCWFFGNGAKDQLLTGHRDHPALVRIARHVWDEEDEG